MDKKTLPLNIVEDNTQLINKGDALIVIGRGKLTQLIIVCPGCGERTASAEGANHVYNRETKSYTPSIVHPCGWHGWVRNGEFIEC